MLCCKGNDLITVIGDLRKGYKKQKRFRYPKKFNKIFNPRKYFVRRKPRYFQRKPWINKKNDLFLEEFLIRLKKCRCYSSNQYGHYANECPKRFNRNKIELNDDMERMIDKKEFSQINRLEDLDEILSEESLYEIETETYITSSEEDSE